MNNVFYPNSVPADVQNAVRGSKLWPLVTGIYSISEGRLGAGRVIANALTMDNKQDALRVYLHTESGQTLLRLADAYSTIRIDARVDSQWKPIIYSKNVRYILKKLAEVREGRAHKVRKRKVEVDIIGNSLKDFINSGETDFLKELNSVVYDYLSNLYDKNLTEGPKLPEKYTYEILGLYAGDLTALQLSPQARECFDKELNAYKFRNQKLAEIGSNTRALFSKEKWLVGYDVPSGKVIVGSVDFTPVVDYVLADPNPWARTYVNKILPHTSGLTMYSSLAALPEEIKSKLYPVMTFAKVMLKRIPQANMLSIDPDRMLFDSSEGNFYDLDTGAVSSRRRVYLFDK